MTDQAAVDQSNVVTNDGRPNMVPGGQVDDPGDLRDDDFGLGGDLRKQLLTALESRWNPDDPGATTLDDEPSQTGDDTQQQQPPADTAATPVPAQPTEPADDTGSAGQDGAGGGRAADDGAAATPPSPDAPPPATTPPATSGDAFDVGRYLEDYFGTPLTRQQAAELAGIIGGLQALTPQQRARLDAVLSGQDDPSYPATMGQPVQQPQYAPPAQPGVAPQPGQPPADQRLIQVLGPRPEDEYLAAQWDMNARAFQAQQQQLDALQQDIARQTQADQARQMAAATTAIASAEESWRSKYPMLNDAEWDGLRDRAARSQQFPALVSAHHGDYNAAVEALYEQQFWADPTLRSRAMANLASGRQPGDGTRVDPTSEVAQQQQATDAGRQALASSVAGGGGSVTPQSSGVPTDPDKRKAAMIAELGAQHDFTQ